MINQYCKIGRSTLPALPCNYDNCSWYVINNDCCNCFWVVADLMHRNPDIGHFTIDEIAEMEGMSSAEVLSLIAKVKEEIIAKHRKFFIKNAYES